MSHLYKHLRIHQVFGANTDVGKTIITTALVRASALKNNRVFYLKPVSTGASQDADDEYVFFVAFNASLNVFLCMVDISNAMRGHKSI
jgi:dethiobiotin synthetase/adenosylmethionine--8-amino-7-oxononanoate aminotransferase